ncbi:type I toxin-antitoxin system toxin Ldr family protein, partial [Escherichia coli]|nr:type I toxin-antitoxin system toxin Ldr family protein [Escherichia coli]HCN1376014.1 type I toxin-antitoxin system toxin Ldr family protein [Escherichia coli]
GILASLIVNWLNKRK